MEIVGAYSDREVAKDVAETLNGRLVVDPREETGHLPFAALVSLDGDQVDSLMDTADIGVTVCFRRVIKARASEQSSGALPGKIAVFPMVNHPDLTRGEADAYWRDQHAPLALRVHVAMSFYTQLSIVHVIRGPEWTGIAHCGFDTLDDLRTRFYETPAGQKEVEKDVVKFADVKNSPRRLICDEYLFT